MGSVTHRRWGALGELMLSHLCPAVDPVLVQPHIPDPCLLHYLSWSDSHTAVYTAQPPAPALLRPLFTFRKQLQILKQRTGFLALCPPQPFQLHPDSVSSCAGSVWVLSHPVCLSILVRLSQSQGAVHRTQEDGSCHSLLLFQGVPCPLSSHSPQWVPLTIYESPHLPPSCECRKAPQPSLFCPRTPAPAMSSYRMFPQTASGLLCLPRKVKVSVMSDSLWPHGLYSQWNSPGQNTGVGGLSFLQGIFSTQGSYPGLLHCRLIL